MATLEEIILAMAKTHDVLDVDGAVEDVISGLQRARTLGWALVPIEPTREMLEAASWAEALAESADGVWREMIAAAPRIGG